MEEGTMTSWKDNLDHREGNDSRQWWVMSGRKRATDPMVNRWSTMREAARSLLGRRHGGTVEKENLGWRWSQVEGTDQWLATVIQQQGNTVMGFFSEPILAAARGDGQWWKGCSAASSASARCSDDGEGPWWKEEEGLTIGSGRSQKWISVLAVFLTRDGSRWWGKAPWWLFRQEWHSGGKMASLART